MTPRRLAAKHRCTHVLEGGHRCPNYTRVRSSSLCAAHRKRFWMFDLLRKQCIAYRVDTKERCTNAVRAKDTELCKTHRPRLRFWELLLRRP